MAVLGDRPATGQTTTATAGGSAVSLVAGNDEILNWLDVLLKGKPDQQAIARTEIAMILEARGFVDDAVEAYWTNVQARAVDRRSYERLIGIYQLRRDRLSETLVRRQFDEVFGEPSPARPRQPDEPSRPPVSLARQLTEPVGPSEPAAPRPVTRRPRGAAPAGVPRTGPVPEAAPPTASAHVPARVSDQASDRGPDRPASSGRRRVALLPNPAPAAGRRSSSRGGLIALQPATIVGFVLASFGAAALIVFLLIASERGGARLPLTAQVPARCADAGQRFPGAHDPRGAVAGAYRQLGVDVEAPRPGGPHLTADQAEQVVGGWMAASLLLEHAGQPAPKLNEWLDTDPAAPTLANAILAGRRLDAMLTAEEWAEVRSWPASNCEGAFVADSRNAGLVRLMERVVAR